MGFKAFTPDEANDAIDKYCNSDTYTADPSYDTTPYGVRIIGYAMDRFWYKDGVYCLTTSPRPPPPNIPADQSVCHSDGSMDFELDVGVKFKTDQVRGFPTYSLSLPIPLKENANSKDSADRLSANETLCCAKG